MKKGFFLRLFVLLMLTFFIAEQGRAQTYQRTSQGIKMHCARYKYRY